MSISTHSQDSVKLNIGISQCLLGEKVRYDGGDKRLAFAVDNLKPYADFYAICPEMAVGLPSPRPTIGLYRCDDQSVIVRFNDRQINSTDINEKLTQFSQQTMPSLADLCGYIVCAKSPSCGLASSSLYDDHSQQFITLTDGVFTAHLRQYYPWLPITDNISLLDADSQTHFLIRILALHRLNEINRAGLSRHALLTFHSRYKSLLLAHSQPLYRQLGPFVAKIDQWDNLADFFIQYRTLLMNLLAIPASRQNHTNVLMHLQGYFNRYLTHEQKQDLTNTILAYHDGQLPLSQPIACLAAYLTEFPHDYLAQQYYFTDYPQPLNITTSN